MDRTLRLIKTTGIYFIGNFASKLLAFFLIPLYTTHLSTSSYGEVDLLLSLLPLIGPIFSLCSVEIIFRFLCEERKTSDGKEAITNTLIIFLIGSLFFVLCYIVVLQYYSITFAFLFICYVIITYVGMFLQQILRGFQNNTDYALVGFLATLIQALCNIYFILVLNLKGESLILSAIVASSFISLYIIFKVKIWQYINFKLLSFSYIKKELKYGLPLIPNLICWWAIQIFGKYFLALYCGANMNGIYAVSEKFPALFTTITSIFFLAWTENLIHEFDSKDSKDYNTTTFNVLFKFFLLVIAVLLPAIKIYNQIAIGGDYSSAWTYIPPLLIGALFNALASFLGSFYTVTMKTMSALITSLIAGVVNIIVSIILIPHISIWGVTFANLITFFVFFIIRFYSVNKLTEIIIDIKLLLMPIAVIVISMIFYYSIETMILQFLSFLIIAIISCFILKNDITRILKTILRRN